MGSCACTGGKCYVFGGEVPRTDPPSLALKIDEQHTVYRVDIYDIASNSWSLGTVRSPRDYILLHLLLRPLSSKNPL